MDEIVECRIVPAMDKETGEPALRDGVPVWAAHVTWLWRDEQGQPAPILGSGTAAHDGFLAQPAKPTPADAIEGVQKLLRASWDQPKKPRRNKRKKA